MPPSLPPMPTTGLGMHRALRKVSTCLPSACTILADGNRVANPEGHPADTKPGGQVDCGVKRPGTDLNAATSWLCDFQSVLNLSELLSVLGANGGTYAYLPSCWEDEPLNESPRDHVVSYHALCPQCPAR